MLLRQTFHPRTLELYLSLHNFATAGHSQRDGLAQNHTSKPYVTFFFEPIFVYHKFSMNESHKHEETVYDQLFDVKRLELLPFLHPSPLCFQIFLCTL